MDNTNDPLNSGNTTTVDPAINSTGDNQQIPPADTTVPGPAHVSEPVSPLPTLGPIIPEPAPVAPEPVSETPAPVEPTAVAPEIPVTDTSSTGGNSGDGSTGAPTM